ncbi:hypothetical protein FKW77_006279 [Venturia effusa]|uniref:DUF2415 domain-containing protein n=1 Tax=Venturia effusa TaxID=50376 RepID=A0A517L1G4_9PEZI|nr:hypothetical protein FKW77_006279 [Venturia effusa]
MTVIDSSVIYDTESFVHKNPKFFSTNIPIHHWQLRNYISNPDGDLLYFASGQDIYSLNVETGIRTHIAKLPWGARCTSAGYGWICTGGGDKGTFAVIRLDPTAEVDYYGNRVLPPPPPHVSLEKLGDEIVNSISIHKLTSDHPAIADDIVAVLTNNDKSIRIFSLSQQMETAVLELPFPVNHATISPDGQLLIAVGDYQQCHFYERADLRPSPDADSQKFASAPCMWELLDVVSLHVPKHIASTGYFSTAWSPNGRLCAVASEMGYISIIDVEALKAFEQGEDAIVAIIASTRAELTLPYGGCPGAVRTMLFSQSPSDLLIWSEDQGRVCVADLRDGLRARQILQLSPKHDGPKFVNVKDNPTNRHIHAREDNAEADYHRQLRSHGIDNDTPIDADDALRAVGQLTAREREREQALGRQRLDSLRNGSAARSIHYSELSGRTQRLTAAQRQEARQSSAFSQDFPDLVRQSHIDTANLLPSSARLVHDYMRDHTTSAEAEPNSYGTRRHVSSFGGEAGASSSNRISSRLLDELATFPGSSRPASSALPDWASIVAITADGETGTLFQREPSRRPSPAPSNTVALNASEVRRRRAVLQEQARRRTLHNREAERYHQMGLYRQDAYDSSYGLRTAGLAVSWDGRKIWAACDKGVFEYEINVRGRMMMPSIEIR